MGHLNNKFKLLPAAVLMAVVSLPAQAGLIGTNQCLADAGGATGCTANDIGIQSIKFNKVIDGCTSTADTAIVQLNMAVTSAQPTRYDIGLHIATDGGDAVTSGNSCVHEALYPVGAPVNLTSGIGPFLDVDGDSCGEVQGGNTYSRTIVQGDVAGGSTTPLDITIACTDSDGNGFVDINWAATWQQNTGSVCTSLADVSAGGPSKCQIGFTDSNDGINPLPVGVPNLGVTISCTADLANPDPDGDPTTLAPGEISICTVTYNNPGTGPADNIEFHIDYPGTEGAVSNLISPASDYSTDNGSTINWVVGGGSSPTPPPVTNIAASATDSFTFEFTSSNNLLQADYPVSVTAYFDNGIDPVVAQPVTASTLVTLPVTVAFVHPQLEGNSLKVDFSTASETMNAGFNLYAVNGKNWRKLNRTIIPGALDSLDTRDYSTSLDLPKGVKLGKFTKLGIGGVDVNGTEIRRGPFPLNQESGSRPVFNPINWGEVRNQIKANKKQAKLTAIQPLTKIKSVERPNFKNAIVDINVPEYGVYQVNDAELMAAGINLKGVHTSKIALSLLGQPVRRHLSGLNKNGRWTRNSAIQFIATGPAARDAVYLDQNKYQLSFNKDLVLRKHSVFKTDNSRSLSFEKNDRYALNIPGSDPFYETWFYAKGSQTPGNFTRVFNLPTMPPSGGSEITAYLGTVSEGEHNIIVSLNGKKVTEVTGHGWQDMPITFKLPTKELSTGENSISFEVRGQDNIFDIYTFDKLEVKYYESTASEFKQATVSVRPRLNKKDLKALNHTDLLVISHPLFMAAPLNRYIEKRQSEGWNVKLVNVEDIYATYGYGMETPGAIKAYLADAAAKGVSHVQLVGAASYDYHDYLGKGSVSFIGSIYTKTGEYSNYTPCDACMVMNSEGVPQMAIGRFPVRTVEGLDTVINKTLDWESSAQAGAHSALFIADKTDTESNTSFDSQMDEVSGLFAEKDWSALTSVNLDDYIDLTQGDMSLAVSKARESIFDTLNAGVSVVSYSGHSSPSTWSFEGLLKVDDIESLQNSGKPTIALPLSCYTTYADSPSVSTLAHQMMAAGDNGAVAMYGAATLSDISANRASAEGVVKELLAGETLGMAILKTKVALGKNYSDIIKNSNLLGDVTLRLE